MTDVVELLDKISTLKNGEFPENTYENDPAFAPNVWGKTISNACAEASAEIKHLRATVTILRRMAGPVSIERSSFHEIKREAKNGAQEPAPGQE